MRLLLALVLVFDGEAVHSGAALEQPTCPGQMAHLEESWCCKTEGTP